MAVSRISGGVLINISNGAEIHCPIIRPITPMATPSSIIVWIRDTILWSLCRPICRAINTFAPTDNPDDRETIKAMISPLVPTAASRCIKETYNCCIGCVK